MILTPLSARTRRIALSCLAAGATLCPTAVLAAPAAASANDLYVVSGMQGSLITAGRPGLYTLRFDAPAARVTGFTDHPQRTATSETLAHFVSDWKARGFAADPPNAALVLDGAPRARDTFVFELTRPRLTRDGALTLSARRLTGVPQGALRSVARGADHVAPPRAFTSASLFVDDGGSPTYTLTLAATLGANEPMVMSFDAGTVLDPYPADAPAAFTTTAAAGLMLPSDAISIYPGTSAATATLSIQISSDSSPITGTMQLPAGAMATASINGGAAIPLAAGRFSLPTG